MVNFSVDQIHELMYNSDLVRNMSVIAHVDHGKSTLTDSLIAKAGIIAMKAAGDDRYMDTRDDEKERGITIKSTGVSLYFDCQMKDGQTLGHLFNLIDSPGHVDFSSEVTAALRVTDGALVVVDCVEGVCVQTETVLRQAMQERIKPVLFVNKVDRNILELQVDGETMYKNFIRVIDNVNGIISTYEDEAMGSLELHPGFGNVAFGSGKECWAFTLKRFAKMYAKKFGMDEEKMQNKLWGDWFFDAKGKKWVTEQNNLKRAFAQFVMDPVIKLARSCMSNDYETVEKMATTMEIVLTTADKELRDKHLLKAVMQKWINAADTILEMMVFHLPSPKAAQKYRYSYLYEGPADDECAKAIRDCDQEGPLMMYVSKQVPTSDKGRFFSYGRVFSGKISTGLKVRMLGSNYKPGSKADVFHGNVQRTVLMMGRKTEFVSEVPCGNLCALVGVDKYITKTGTITTSDEAHNIRNMKYSVSPVVRVAVQPKNPGDLPKLIQGMNRLSKSDPLVLCINDEATGQNIVCGSGELHVEICINDLINEYAQIPIIQSTPVVSYKETVSEEGDEAMSKSANKHNRLHCHAMPISEELAQDIESEKITIKMDVKERTKIMVNDHDWDKAEVLKIWSFGPDNEGPNIIVDASKGCQFMHEIKDSMVTGFQVVTAAGVLCDEGVRSMRMNVLDTTLHPDSIHRGGGQIIPTSRRVFYACQLKAAPRLQEPFFLVEITCPNDCVGSVYSCLTQKRGEIDSEESVEGTPITIIKAYLPVSESFGFTGYLRSHTAGQAFPNCSFHHWGQMTSDPLAENENQVNKIVKETRVRKGLKPEVYPLSHFEDKL
jgi:elongation factor 2